MGMPLLSLISSDPPSSGTKETMAVLERPDVRVTIPASAPEDGRRSRFSIRWLAFWVVAALRGANAQLTNG